MAVTGFNGNWKRHEVFAPRPDNERSRCTAGPYTDYSIQTGTGSQASCCRPWRSPRMSSQPSSPMPARQFCGRTRREFLWEIGGGFGAVALTGLLSADGFFAQRAGAAEAPNHFLNPLAPKPSHYAAKAKSVIFLFMYGGPSHVDTFDYKPRLFDLDGKMI